MRTRKSRDSRSTVSGLFIKRATNSHGTMDIFKNRYFRLSRNFMLWIGMWPYDTSSWKTLRRAALPFLFLSIGIVEVPAFNFLTQKNCDCILRSRFFIICKDIGEAIDLWWKFVRITSMLDNTAFNNKSSLMVHEY